jgi:cation-transporting ATPase 13A1
MTLAVHIATEAMGPEKLKEVAEFFKKAKAKEIDAASNCGEDDFMCQMNAFWTAPFLPNLLNTTVFLVETSQMISVFFANYKGRPWMKGMLENHALFLSVFACIGGVVVASWELVPKLNELIQLAPFPNDSYRLQVVGLVLATIAGTFLWDRLCVLVFAPEVSKATFDEAKKTTWKDIFPVLLTLFKVVAAVAVLGTGNIVLAGVAYYTWRNMNAPKPASTASPAQSVK